MVAALANELRTRDELRLVVPAEGTRSRTEYWKSGFYRIAEQAEVPIVLAYVDRSTRSGGFGPAIDVTGDGRLDILTASKLGSFVFVQRSLEPR